MKIVNSTPNELKENLVIAIQKAITNFKENYYTYGNHDFQRNRVLTMNKVVTLLHSMQDGSLTKELYDAGTTRLVGLNAVDSILWNFKCRVK